MNTAGSIWSFPDRGPWGNAAYRGNCSGHVYRSHYERLRPNSVIDPCQGSGTSIDVAHEMGITALGFDLKTGFNVLRDSILATAGAHADLVISHPPYHDMIVYSGEVYPEASQDDLSRSSSVDEFLERAVQMLLNQRDATVPGGHYATLIGDQRKAGKYLSYQAELIARMPRDELAGVIIKAQHNCHSDRRQYHGPPRLPLIQHEYLLVWRRPRQIMSWLSTLATIASQQKHRLKGTWKAIVRQALVSAGGTAKLPQLYERISGNARDRTDSNPHWKAQVRMVLQIHDDFARVERGTWTLA